MASGSQILKPYDETFQQILNNNILSLLISFKERYLNEAQIKEEGSKYFSSIFPEIYGYDPKNSETQRALKYATETLLNSILTEKIGELGKYKDIRDKYIREICNIDIENGRRTAREGVIEKAHEELNNAFKRDGIEYKYIYYYIRLLIQYIYDYTDTCRGHLSNASSPSVSMPVSHIASSSSASAALARLPDVIANKLKARRSYWIRHFCSMANTRIRKETMNSALDAIREELLSIAAGAAGAEEFIETLIRQIQKDSFNCRAGGRRKSHRSKKTRRAKKTRRN